MAKRIVNMKVLPGEPLDGAGRVCIHFLVQDTAGPFVEPHVLHPVVEGGTVVKRKLQAKPTRCRLACDAKRLVAPVTRNGVTTETSRTDDPRAVTCPKCITTEEYKESMERLEQLAQTT
jgi:hypothetical protein